MKQISQIAATAAALLIFAGCGNSGKKTEPVTYDGETSFVPNTVNATTDTVLSIDSTEYRVINIRRFNALKTENGNNDFSISMNIDIPAGNERIAGEIASYVCEIMDAFRKTGEDSPLFLGIDSVAPRTTDEVVALCDSSVSRFVNVIAPQAISESVVGTTVDITVTPVFINDSYVTYAMYSSSFLGGAHAEEDFFLQTYDAASGIPVNFYSLVPADRQEAVRRELIETIAATKGLAVGSYLASVNQWAGMSGEEDWTVKNFPIYHIGLTGQGYVFCYPKYTIAPGSEGVGVYVVPAEGEK